MHMYMCVWGTFCMLITWFMNIIGQHEDGTVWLHQSQLSLKLFEIKGPPWLWWYADGWLSHYDSGFVNYLFLSGQRLVIQIALFYQMKNHNFVMKGVMIELRSTRNLCVCLFKANKGLAVSMLWCFWCKKCKKSFLSIIIMYRRTVVYLLMYKVAIWRYGMLLK